MKVLGIDPSTKTGVCVLEAGMTEPSISFSTEISMPASVGVGVGRARRIAAEVIQLAVEFDVDLAVIEGYGFANHHSLVVLVEIGTLIRDRLMNNKFPLLVVAPTQLKKFVLGKGVGKKDQMRLGVYKRWGFEADSDNEVDAYALSAIGLAFVGELASLIAPQIEVIKKLQRVPDGPAIPRRER